LFGDKADTFRFSRHIIPEMVVPLIAQLAIALGASPSYGDGENTLWRKIALVCGATPAYGDSTAALLDKIRRQLAP
jgi:hypothetical protein